MWRFRYGKWLAPVACWKHMSIEERALVELMTTKGMHEWRILDDFGERQR